MTGPGRRDQLPALVLGACVLVGALLVAGAGLKGALTYYETPTELDASPVASTTTVRLAGLVVAGTVRRDGGTVRFTLSDGAKDVPVVSTDTPPGTFRAGQGAVVEGHKDADGVFHADQIIVRHSNEYRPPSALTS